ncbi:MAG: restriction endonuclease [Leptospiraceae bacterium]|nr:restriction endonuclease [Leptospiraceae bacterium]
MAVPDFQSIMLPLLKFLKDKKEHTNKEIIEHISNHFNLSSADRDERLPSSSSVYLISNRVGWAETHMKMAGLIESPRRAIYRITNEGIETLQKNLSQINLAYLKNFKKYQEKRDSWNSSYKDNTQEENKEISNYTPDEMVELGYKKIRQELSLELLQIVKDSSPKFFENLVVDLLLKMGYGGSIKDSGSVIGKSNDEGIDGLIKEDKLGLDVIYIQAKKWEASIGRPEIQKFVGALQGQRAKKGIFITTSSFNENAYNYVSNIDIKVVLINGEELTNLMIDYNIGVSVKNLFEIKKIDSDYFAEE